MAQNGCAPRGFALYPVPVKRHGGKLMRFKIEKIRVRFSPEIGVFALLIAAAAVVAVVDPALAQTSSSNALTQAGTMSKEVKNLGKAGWTVGLVVVSILTTFGGAMVSSKLLRGDTATADWKKWGIGAVAGASAPTLVSVVTGLTPW